MKKFDIFFLEEAFNFLNALDDKTREKIIYNIDKASVVNDPELFKKLVGEIWEFRTKYNNNQYRLLAFWDKRDKQARNTRRCHAGHREENPENARKRNRKGGTNPPTILR